MTVGVLLLMVLATMAGAAVPASAALPKIAVFGDNYTDNYLTGTGLFDVTLVTDDQLSLSSTPSFLSGFDAFFYTRNGTTFGTTLSAAAAANVRAFVGSSGRGILMNGDFADSIDPALTGAGNTDPKVEQLFANSVAWAAATHHGFVGEYTGAVAGLTSNSNVLAALNFVSGNAGALGTGPAPGAGPADGTIVKTAAGATSPVLDGVTFPLTDPSNQIEFGSIVTGVDASLVLARYNNPGQLNDGNPAVIQFLPTRNVTGLALSVSPTTSAAGFSKIDESNINLVGASLDAGALEGSAGPQNAPLGKNPLGKNPLGKNPLGKNGLNPTDPPLRSVPVTALINHPLADPPLLSDLPISVAGGDNDG